MQVDNRVMKIWLDDLKHVVYDADDILDESRTRVDSAGGHRRKVLSYFLSPFYCGKHVMVRNRIGHQIKEINDRLGLISEQRNHFGLQLGSTGLETRGRETTSLIAHSEIMYGCEEAKYRILRAIDTSRYGRRPEVISIVGQVGLGKSTLAFLIFEDYPVFKMLEKKMWVNLSSGFHRGEVAREIIKQDAGKVIDSIHWEDVREGLSKVVQGKRFLLVLDDMSEIEFNHWSPMKLILDGGHPESRIIITTHKHSVAIQAGSAYVHDMERLNDEDSWLLLRRVAADERYFEDEDETEIIGRELAVKCNGNPLSIITLASCLRVQTTEEWKDMLEVPLWEMQRMMETYLPRLFRNYYSLDMISKQCLLYCAVFPEDADLKKADLIKLWMAQGFFGFDETRDLERIGGEHFNILVMDSWFQDLKKDSDGNITGCKMDEIVRQFAKHLTQAECFSIETDAAKIDKERTRHLHAKSLQNQFICEAKKLRTLILHKESIVPSQIFQKLKCLRSLDLSYSLIEVLPDEVKKLVHLRYLDLSGTILCELPEMICNLFNLQTLKLNKCKKLRKFPKGIGKLCNLRHLEFIETDAVKDLPQSIARLSSLRTLCNFSENGLDLGGNIGFLKLLNNLQGALQMKCLNRVTDLNEVIQAELKMKSKLRALNYNFELSGEESDVVTMERVFDELKPHEGLEILDLQYYPGSKFPHWVESCSFLPKIVEMRLYMCNGCTFLPALGQLTSLVTLRIEGMDSVKHIDHDFYGSVVGAQMKAFQKLKNLQIKNMKQLEKWELPISNDTEIMPSLRELHLQACPMLKVLPCFGKLESLEKLRIQEIQVKKVGLEFYGLDVDGSFGPQITSFSRLRKLTFSQMSQWTDWELPISKNKIMPSLCELELKDCMKLRALPGLGKLESLEILTVERLNWLKQVGPEFLGLSEVVTDHASSVSDRAVFTNQSSSLPRPQEIIFPKLRRITFHHLHLLEQWSIPFNKNGWIIMPCLTELKLSDFPKMTALPLFSHIRSLESLSIHDMPEWGGTENEEEEEEIVADFYNLREVYIKECPKLRVVPHYIQKLKTNMLPGESSKGN